MSEGAFPRSTAAVSVFTAVCLALVSNGCLPDPYEVGTPDSTLSEYLLIWQLVDQNYSCFCVRQDVDWDGAYLDYRAMAEQAQSREELTAAALLMLGELDDHQIALFDSTMVRRDSYDTDRFINFDMPVWLQYMQDLEPSPDSVMSAFGSGLFIDDDDTIGYLYLSDLGNGYSLEGFYESAGTVRYWPGLIFDLRMCGGIGAEVNARSAVGKFVAQSAIGYYSSSRVGADRYEMTEPTAVRALKNGSWQFTEPILLLTGRGTCGAAEQLVLLLASQEHVTLIGDTTAGFANPGPFFNLTDGWTISIPGIVTYDTAMEPVFDRGDPPDIAVPVTQADFDAGIDPVLDAALEILSR